MSIKTKIQEGTGRLTGKPLCFSCRHGVQRGSSLCCSYYGEVQAIREQIFNCNVYLNASLPSLSDMKEVAWELKTSGGRKIGFYPPKKDRNRLVDDD